MEMVLELELIAMQSFLDFDFDFVLSLGFSYVRECRSMARG